MPSSQERLLHLFRGLERAHGTSVLLQRKSRKGKVEAKYNTIHSPVTTQDWTNHLEGNVGLFTIPIRDNGTVLFGVIDVDIYPLDLTELVNKIGELKFPLVPCRTKSGGAHLYLFFEEERDAAEIQELLFNWSAAIGYPKCEVFPKQTELASELDTGNGLNMPYFNSNNTTRYCINDAGEAVTLKEFLDRAEKTIIPPEQELHKVEIKIPEELEGAPPCLQHWAKVGIEEGQRNDVLFDFAIYAKKRWPSEWQTKFEDLNRRYADPPLQSAEVLALIKSVGKQKEYLYRSKCEGPYCNPQVCKKQEHGRGGGYDDPGVIVDSLAIINTDPKVYIVSINGRRVEMDSSCLLNQLKFRTVVLEQLSILMKPVKTANWARMGNRLLEQADHIDAPEDAGPRGQLLLYLREFLDKHVSEEREKLILEHAWRDEQHGRIYFRSKDFIAYLKKYRVYSYRERDIFMAVRSIGGRDELLRISKSKTSVRCWWIPDYKDDEDGDPLPIPDVTEGSIEDEVTF